MAKVPGAGSLIRIVRRFGAPRKSRSKHKQPATHPKSMNTIINMIRSTPDWAYSSYDIIVAAILLAGIGLTFRRALRRFGVSLLLVVATSVATAVVFYYLDPVNFPPTPVSPEMQEWAPFLNSVGGWFDLIHTTYFVSALCLFVGLAVAVTFHRRSLFASRHASHA